MIGRVSGRDKTNAPRDPFVKVYLLPDENTCQQSRVRRKTLAPKFNDTFTFQVDYLLSFLLCMVGWSPLAG